MAADSSALIKRFEELLACGESESSLLDVYVSEFGGELFPHEPPQDALLTTSLAYDGLLGELVWACNHNFGLSSGACAAASWGGHLEVLEYLYELGAPYGLIQDPLDTSEDGTVNYMEPDIFYFWMGHQELWKAKDSVTDLKPAKNN